jgi:uncharacterized membrane protein YgcG
MISLQTRRKFINDRQIYLFEYDRNLNFFPPLSIKNSMTFITMKAVKFLFAFLLGIALILLPVLPLTAQTTSPFYWDFINVDMEVQENGDMLVTETQKYVFTASHTNQRYRYIPLDGIEQITDIAVFEGDRQIPSTTGIDNNQQWIQWQHELKPPDTHTFVLKYRVVGGLQVDSQKTQVYWKAIFPDRKAPVNAAKVTVKLPEVLSGKVLSFQNYGVSAIDRQVNPTTFEFMANKAVQPGEELEVQVTFPTEVLNLDESNSLQSLNQTTDDETSFTFTWKNWGILSLALLFLNRWIKLKFKLIVSIATLIICLILLLVFIPLIWTSPPIGIFIITILFLIARSPLKEISTYLKEKFMDSKCPKCKQQKLKRTSEVLRAPTSIRKGRRWIVHHCDNCSYHNEFAELIPFPTRSGDGGGFGGSSDGGGFGGGDGGGGGGDGGGGGGGG